MTTAEYLNTLIDCKQDMKSAIEGKGVTVTGGLSTYADAIKAIRNKNFPKVTTLRFGSSFRDITGHIDFNEIFLDTFYYTDMSNMFINATKLTAVYNIDTRNTVDMSAMFMNCMSLTKAPNINTSNVTDMSSMFNNCQTLNYVPLLDCGNVEDVNNMFSSAALHNEITMGGFKDLGKKENLAGTEYMFTGQTIINNIANNMTHETIMNIVNNLYDRATAGYSSLTIDLPLLRMTDEEKAIATNKGWILYDTGIGPS